MPRANVRVGPVRHQQMDGQDHGMRQGQEEEKLRPVLLYEWTATADYGDPEHGTVLALSAGEALTEARRLAGYNLRDWRRLEVRQFGQSTPIRANSRKNPTPT